MSYIPDCRTDEHYNQKFLTGADKKFVRGFDWCVEMAVDNFFDNEMFDLAQSDSYLGHILNETVPDELQEEYTQEHVFLNDGEEERQTVTTYADLIR